MLTDFTNSVLNLFQDMWYLGIYIMMLIESSFIPFPSEVAMIPAGANAASGNMNFLMALLAGTAGAWTGATINYFLGYFLWAPIIRTLVKKYGKYIFISEKHYLQSEKFFQENGGKTTFFGRFIPAVRQLISLPAGVFKMNFLAFSLFTILGAGLWNLFLMIIGYSFGEYKDSILHYATEIILGVLVVCVLFFGYKFYKKRKQKTSQQSQSNN